MPNSDRMQWPFPSENQDPYYQTFLSMMQAMDASGYAAREDRNIFLSGGGTFTFNSGTGLMTWASDVRILGLVTGYYWYFTAGSISLADGQVAYVDLDRHPTGNSALTLQKADTLPSSDSALAICIRLGNRIYFRNGRILLTGVPVAVLDIETGSGGGGASPLVAKGDIYTHDGVSDAREPIGGVDGMVATVDSTKPNGWTWKTSAAGVSPYPDAGSGIDPYLRYLSSSGSDANDGETLLTAWRSPGKVEAWLKTLINNPTTVIVDGDFSAEPVPYLTLHGVRTVQGGSLLVCGRLTSMGTNGIMGVIASPNDPIGGLSARARITLAAPLPVDPQQYLVQFPRNFFGTAEYAVILDFSVTGNWIEISAATSEVQAAGNVEFFTTTSNLEVRMYSCDGDAPPPPYTKKSIGVMGLRCSTNQQQNIVNGCTGIVFAGIFGDGTLGATTWNLFDNTFLSFGYLEQGNPLIVQANSYLLPSPIQMSMAPAGFFGLVGYEVPTVAVGSSRDVTFTGMVAHKFASAHIHPSNQFGGNGELGFRFCRWDGNPWFSFDTAQVVGCLCNGEIRLYKTKMVYSGVYFHDTYGSDDFTKSGCFRAIDSELAVLTSGIRTGDPSLGSMGAIYIFRLIGSKWTMLDKYNFSDVVDVSGPVFLLENSEIQRDETQSSSYGQLRFAQGAYSLKGSANDACIVMDGRSLVKVQEIRIANAFSLNPMPLVRGTRDSTLIVNANINLGPAVNFGPDGAVVMKQGGWVEYGGMVGSNTDPANIVLSLDKGARGYHPSIGTNPTPPANLYLGGAGVIPYPMATANDLAGPAASELCILSR